MLAAREGDHRGDPYPLTYGDGPGEYRPTPPDFSEYPPAWVAGVTPFLAESVEYYRTEGPYALDSAEYAAEFNEVKSVGAADGSTRTDEQNALIAFWITPIGQWSQVERSLAAEKGLDIVDATRLFAMANLAAGDAASACHEDKYHWMFWRPITAIQEAESDGNPATAADPDWIPLANTLTPPNTPPYPEHPSGWNCYAGAHVGALQEFFGTDEMVYQITNPNIPEPRSYTSFSQGLQEVSTCASSRASTFAARTCKVPSLAGRPQPSPPSGLRPWSDPPRVAAPTSTPRSASMSCTRGSGRRIPGAISRRSIRTWAPVPWANDLRPKGSAGDA